MIIITSLFIVQGEAEVLDSSSSDEVTTTIIFSDYCHTHSSRLLI